ncbi:MAG: thiamine pyrophosphate-binding protein [Candidatus Hodarchaeales archaeon]|jgi:hypothetical protein
MSEKISYPGGSLGAKSLVKEEVKYKFSISGGHINPIYRALTEEGIKIVTTHHESGELGVKSGRGFHDYTDKDV